MIVRDYRALAEFRFLIRRHLNNAEEAGRSVGLRSQQYQCMLALRGLPHGQEPTILALAERLQTRHHSAVELVDRMETKELFRRERSSTDRRRVLVHMTARGERLLIRLVHHRIAELRVLGPELVRALSAIMGAKPSLRRHR